uniref:BRCT domain-containing protein n=1 Tax=Panagrolaimus superbus TaxID=310955 RepID=A0A914YPP5_9BILA
MITFSPLRVFLKKIYPIFSEKGHSKRSNSPKVAKALTAFGNTVLIVNLSWLCELYMGLTAPLSDIGNRRFSVNTNVPLEVGPVTLSKFHENIGRMMAPWQYPLAITEEHLKRAKEIRESVLNDESVFAIVKYPSIFCDDIIPRDEEIYLANKLLEENGCKPELKIAFTGFDPREVNILSRKIRTLGVEIVEKIERCNLLVAPALVRSTSIFKAAASGKNIISPLWIATCFNRLRLVDSDDFVLRDVNAEKILGSGGGIIDKAQPSRYTLQKYLDKHF